MLLLTLKHVISLITCWFLLFGQMVGESGKTWRNSDILTRQIFFSKINILMKIQHFDDSSHLINRDHDSWCIRVKPSRPKIGVVWYNNEVRRSIGGPSTWSSLWIRFDNKWSFHYESSWIWKLENWGMKNPKIGNKFQNFTNFENIANFGTSKI